MLARGVPSRYPCAEMLPLEPDDSHFMDAPEDIVRKSVKEDCDFEAEVLLDALNRRQNDTVRNIVRSMEADGALKKGGAGVVDQYLNFQRNGVEEE